MGSFHWERGGAAMLAAIDADNPTSQQTCCSIVADSPKGHRCSRVLLEEVVFNSKRGAMTSQSSVSSDGSGMPPPPDGIGSLCRWSSHPDSLSSTCKDVHPWWR